MLVIDHKLAIPLREFDFTFVRSSGPGGQNVNKVNTKVTLRWPVTTSTSLPEAVRTRFATRYPRRISKQGDLLVTSQRFRDQGRNVADCLEKLRAMILAVAQPPKSRKPTRPTRGSRERRLQTKQRRSQTKRLRQSPRPDD
ncbi:MAG: alternative ribosome rescue aminoacyl-tRNA hydrolase ArfB [Pirellulaceae bacterium]